MNIYVLNFDVFAGRAHIPWQKPSGSIGTLYLQKVCSGKEILQKVSELLNVAAEEPTSSVTLRNAAVAMALIRLTSSSGVNLSISGKSTKFNEPDGVVLCSGTGVLEIFGRRV